MNFKLSVLTFITIILTSCTGTVGVGISVTERTDDIPPEINAAFINNKLNFSPGDNVSLGIAITDDSGLANITLDSGKLGINQSESISDNNRSITLNLDIQLPVDIEIGDYEIIISTTDIHDNSITEVITLSVE